jgi:very-short-patch-repair endonuclease
MIAIEIDGRQHKKPERKRTDDLKDALLKERGWTVYRINWPEDNIIESIKRIFNIT